MDTAAQPQDDFYSYVNGTGSRRPRSRPTSPPTACSPSSPTMRRRTCARSSRTRRRATRAASTPISARSAISTPSFLDEPAIEAAGLKPLEATFARIDAAKNGTDIAVLMAELGRTLTQPGTFGPAPTLPFNIVVHQDNKDATKYIADLQQSGLGLPDRDYYIKDDDAKLKGIRAQYQAFLEKIFA